MFTKTVIKGDGMGNVLGYPTANFDISYDELSLSPGVYACEIVRDGVRYKSALCVHADIEKVEAYILDFPDIELYGETLTVEPLDKVSDFRECGTLHELKSKIADDVAKVQAYFEA